MGYPMTWKRLVGRNGLLPGDDRLAPRVNMLTGSDSNADVSAVRRERVSLYDQQCRNLISDVQRLERDGTDEGELCRVITARIPGAATDLVAAVLKEFFAL